ncbi:uncharacterized protein LOC109858953 [Pseudomyrmex gracilis]|uniref:uncharacterized protein LOC109858953 n=1 Tax=Pseudomyrmex gracilis TaxID=219809 RepID=UPI0009958713|nr:uncharacterized protein LOC109858953 [Pseudomyrmex gracilis]
MEPRKLSTPSKTRKIDNPLINNLFTHRTPMKQHETRPKRTMYHQNNTLTVLPGHITPPSKMKEFIIKNPFEPDLTNRLHMSVISPTVFAKTESPSHESPQFTWNIDELAHIKPAKIEEFPIHQVHSPDPGLEVKAQAAINQFFKKNQIIPSPWDDKQLTNKPYIQLDTPNRPLDDINSSKDLSKSKKDVWCQTVLSLPLNLPQNVEEVLKPFFTFTQDQNEQSTDNEEANVSNSSLRRKLFFAHDECHNDDESIASLSPLKVSESMRLSCSPPQSGMFVHGTPLKMRHTKQRSDEYMIKLEHLSPPNMSPIFNIKNNMKVESCSVTRLDFMDISADNMLEEKKQSPPNQWVLDTSLNENSVKDTEDNCKVIIVNNDKRTLCDSININEKLAKCVNLNDYPRHCDATMLNENNCNDGNFKLKTDMETSVHEERKQIVTMFNSFDQQNSNAVQDTGYQTYSMNNTMQIVDSYSNTSVNHKVYTSEQVMSRDNTQLSWKENIKKNTTCQFGQLVLLYIIKDAYI